MSEALFGALGLKLMGGAIGGALLAAVDMPKSRGEFLGRGICALGGSYLFTGFALQQFGLPRNDEEATIAVAGAIGFLTYFVLGMVVRFFHKRNDKDLVDVFKEGKDLLRGGTEEKR